MSIDVTNVDGIIALQGQRILVKRTGHPDRVFTFIHRVDEHDGQKLRELRMVYRVKGKPTVDWSVKQPLFNTAKPVAGSPEYQWEVTVK